MNLKQWVLNQTNTDDYACMERVYEHMSETLNISKSSIKQWVSGQRQVSAEHVLKIEKITDGMVTRNNLRSDIYPD
jgi:DNA-binding transcriptional regulator YdaS (Cro superfamily)